MDLYLCFLCTFTKKGFAAFMTNVVWYLIDSFKCFFFLFLFFFFIMWDIVVTLFWVSGLGTIHQKWIIYIFCFKLFPFQCLWIGSPNTKTIFLEIAWFLLLFCKIEYSEKQVPPVFLNLLTLIITFIEGTPELIVFKTWDVFLHQPWVWMFMCFSLAGDGTWDSTSLCSFFF